jgi:hypothetical protein
VGPLRSVFVGGTLVSLVGLKAPRVWTGLLRILINRSGEGGEGVTSILGTQKPNVDDIEQQHEDHVEEDEATQTRGGPDGRRGLAPRP